MLRATAPGSGRGLSVGSSQPPPTLCGFSPGPSVYRRPKAVQWEFVCMWSCNTVVRSGSPWLSPSQLGKAQPPHDPGQDKELDDGRTDDPSRLRPGTNWTSGQSETTISSFRSVKVSNIFSVIKHHFLENSFHFDFKEFFVNTLIKRTIPNINQRVEHAEVKSLRSFYSLGLWLVPPVKSESKLRLDRPNTSQWKLSF